MKLTGGANWLRAVLIAYCTLWIGVGFPLALAGIRAPLWLGVAALVPASIFAKWALDTRQGERDEDLDH